MNKYYIIAGLVCIIIGCVFFRKNNALGIYNLMFGVYSFTRGLYDRE